MEWITLIGIGLTFFIGVYNASINIKLAKHKNLTNEQELCLNVLQILAGNIIDVEEEILLHKKRYKQKNKTDIDDKDINKLEYVIEKYVVRCYPDYKTEISCFTNPVIWFLHKMRISTTSNKVHRILLNYQEGLYKETMTGNHALITFSLLYKEFYKDLKHLNIGDLDYLRFSINDLVIENYTDVVKELKKLYGLTFISLIKLKISRCNKAKA
ncbi:MAG: hypothetical protein PHQ32_06480 [Firmicutes bacterium]|nr:hypothetical protein [Bacillota bacterium]